MRRKLNNTISRNTNGGFPVEIDSINSYIRNVLDEINRNEDKEVIFRGHAVSSWELKPSIGRRVYDKEIERKIFYQFKRQYYSYTEERPNTDMELLFLAQHYGLPTRLLDWTYNPMVALYFACESGENDNEDGSIYSYALAANSLYDSNNDSHSLKTLDDIMAMKNAIFVIPDYTDARYKNQKALFLLSDKPNKIFTFPGPPKYLIKKESKSQIRHDLALIGFDKTLVYPMLDSLCSDIKGRCSFGI